MLFWLKKGLALPFLPLYFTLFAGTFGCLLLWSEKRRKWGRLLVCAAIGCLVASSNKGVARALLGPIELQYPAIPDVRSAGELPSSLRDVKAVAVLGGGHGDAPELSRVNQLSGASLSRIAEAVRLARLLPDAKFIVSGHHLPNLSHARVLGEAAISLGIDPARIVMLETPRDTEDEANELRRMMGNEPVALVTSAWHMPRAVRLCTTAGVRAVPCPADFSLKPGADHGWALLTWDLGALDRSNRAIREYLGMAWLSLRGR
jgi:uncharacterized SAM-binding protein YcdF (DUF218 family)